MATTTAHEAHVVLRIVTVGKTVSVSTTLSATAISLGGTFSDSATISGGSSPTGTVTFNVYGTNTCASAVLFTSTNSVSAAAAQSSTFGPVTTAGTCLSAAYSGDANDNLASRSLHRRSRDGEQGDPEHLDRTLSATSVAQGGSFQ